ncbi:FMN-binding protein [Herbiconiux sp. YIM B11900]|uniref:FMN-binding protein n=1 Tax=Herbiconiux sp. YIM B11900 TaxID=3404131 RepID=UPI003F87745E
MRARALLLGILSSTAVLAVGWQLGTQGETQTAPDAAVASSSGSSTASTSGTSGTSETTGASGTFTGSSVQTRFGAVQVQITVADGTITDVTALHLTDKDQRSVSISNRAAPVLRQEVITAQSANVQGVSGATYTSDGYLSSMQSALDQAGL